MVEFTEAETSYIFAGLDPDKVGEAVRLLDMLARLISKGVGVTLVRGTTKIRTMGPV